MRQQAEVSAIVEKLIEKEGNVADPKDPFEVPGRAERKGGSKRTETVDKTNMEKLEKALQPYEKELRRQERFRRSLGVREVDQPTYLRYITGPV